ncbi:MAG TPA: hypothetical protein VMP68_06375 [Candidatus Eisenbacteria bacterium]|nr:hypothetical protein [Candidatus Eisenbacteria bacterium]
MNLFSVFGMIPLALPSSTTHLKNAHAFRGLLMTSEEREKMNRLCERIEEEKDPDRFTKLVQELNELLEQKEDRLKKRGPN